MFLFNLSVRLMNWLKFNCYLWGWCLLNYFIFQNRKWDWGWQIACVPSETWLWGWGLFFISGTMEREIWPKCFRGTFFSSRFEVLSTMGTGES